MYVLSRDEMAVKKKMERLHTVLLSLPTPYSYPGESTLSRRSVRVVLGPVVWVGSSRGRIGFVLQGTLQPPAAGVENTPHSSQASVNLFLMQMDGRFTGSNSRSVVVCPWKKSSIQQELGKARQEQHNDG
jgi:hypothetical protein